MSIFSLDSNIRVTVQTMKKAAANPITMSEVCVRARARVCVRVYLREQSDLKNLTPHGRKKD